MTAPNNSSTQAAEKEEYRGEILHVLRELLAKRRDDEVVALVERLVSLNSDLQRRLAEMLMRRKKGEGVSSAQLELFLDEMEREDEEALDKSTAELKKASELESLCSEKKKPPKKKPPQQPRSRQPFPPELRRIDNPITIPEDERACPVCGAERTCIGHDVTEVVDLIPAEVVVRVDRREKLACKACEGEVVRAQLGDKVVSGGKFGSSFVATLLVNKYRDGLPLNRQQQILEGLGLSVPVSTLADQVTWSTELLMPVWRAAREAVLASTVMHVDGTGIAVRDLLHPAHLKLGTLWGYVGDYTALYLYTSTGKKRGQRPEELGPEDMLAMRTGYTVADAATLFDASFRREDLIECGCNMHARRYFKKALDAGDRRAALVLKAYQSLYKIEEEIIDRSPDERLTARKKRSVPIYDALVKWCELRKGREPPSTPMAKAIGYLLNHQVALQRYLDDGVLPMDNGAVERLHIRVALTRKNFLFAGSDAGAERAAIIYTILGCCAMADVNPVEYLNDVLPRLARGIKLKEAAALLPARWKSSVLN